MKRPRVHVSVDDPAHSMHFYNTLFAVKPTVTKHDHATWMLNDPQVNFASSRCGRPGVDRPGIQVETPNEGYGRLQKADEPVLEEGATTCCHAKPEKSRIAGPQGLIRETFLPAGESTVYGDSVDLGPIRTAACRTPQTPQGARCTLKPELAAVGPCYRQGAAA
jgi:hypothetical protein